MYVPIPSPFCSVYEVYSSELKKQLQESLVANQRLEECCARLEKEVARSEAERRLVESKVAEIQQREQERVDGVVELLSSMACVRVTQVEISGDTAVYTCAIIYGSMKGRFVYCGYALIVVIK